MNTETQKQETPKFNWKIAQLPEWQIELDRFVSREVYYCASELVSELLQNEKYMEELLPVCTRDNWIDAAHEEGEGSPVFEDEDEAREYCEEHSIDPHTDEAYEHWIVSGYLADKLESRGGMIIKDFLGLTIWGRPTTGQSISADCVISEIYWSTLFDDEKQEWVSKVKGE